MAEQVVFPAGTEAKCNRCRKASPLPKDCKGHLDTTNSRSWIYRLDTMSMLDCGHMDAHWVYRTEQA